LEHSEEKAADAVKAGENRENRRVENVKKQTSEKWGKLAGEKWKKIVVDKPFKGVAK